MLDTISAYRLRVENEMMLSVEKEKRKISDLGWLYFGRVFGLKYNIT